jgi:hypothetical protein
MVQKQFLVGVPDIIAYDASDNIWFQSKTLLNSTLEVSVGSTEIRGGRGNQLLSNYFHTTAMTISLEETQFNLAMLGATTGQSVVTGNDVYTEENVTLGGGGAGTVTGTPLVIQGTTVYGWVKLVGGATERVTFTGQNFIATGGSSGQVVCVRYYATNAASRSITIPANIMPSVVRLEMNVQLNGSDVGTQKIGTLQIIVPKFQLNGAFTLNLASDKLKLSQ